MMRMTDPLTAVELPEGGALCAVSGGLDSMCLLEMTVRQGQKQGRRVAAAHFNHQLRGAAADQLRARGLEIKFGPECRLARVCGQGSGKDGGLFPVVAAEGPQGGF